jgi:hypothetical protein
MVDYYAQHAQYKKAPTLLPGQSLKLKQIIN